MDPMPILTRRRIEAEFARGLHRELTARFGEATATDILSTAVTRMAREAGAAMAADAPEGPDLDHFRSIQALWTAEDALRTRINASDAEHYDFDVVRCCYAEMYRALGLEKLGATLSCDRDAAFSEGYGGGLALTRTQTIMQGASHCDFRYRRTPPDARGVPGAIDEPGTVEKRKG